MIYIYTRVSTDKQTNDNQIHSIASSFPNAVVYQETASGAGKRPILNNLLSQMNKGDTLIVSALDRLGRRTSEILHLIEDLNNRGIILKSIREGVDYSTPTGRLVIQVMLSVAELERSLISERTKAALARAKTEGVSLGGRRPGAGRPKRKTQDESQLMLQVLSLHNKGLSTYQIGELCGVSQSKAWKLLRLAKR